MHQDNIAYRPDIDGLRAVAVCCVIFYHAGSGFPGGFVGVDVFFVISGFLITRLILRDLDRNVFSLAEFWERRIRRIFPALLTVTVASLVAGWFLLMPDAYQSFGRSVAALVLLSSNFHFWREAGYFDAAAESKPLLHTWSIAVEEQFYLLMPFVLLFIARGQHRQRVFLLLCGAGFVSLFFNILEVRRHLFSAYYLLPARAWELCAGALLAFTSECGLIAKRCMRELGAAVGLGLILVPVFIYDKATPFPGFFALPPVIGAFSLIFVGMHERCSIVNRMLSWRPLVAVGRISYSLYLWHWPLLAFAKYQSAGPPPFKIRIFLVAACFVLAVISWRFVEEPFRRRKSISSRPRVFIATGMALVVLLSSGLLVYFSEGFAARFTSQAQLFAATGKRNEKYVVELEARDIPKNLARLGHPGAHPDLLVWGDSHAMSILAGIDELGSEMGVTVFAATHSSTAPLYGWSDPNGRDLRERAAPFTTAVMDYILSHKVPAVLLHCSWETYLTHDQGSTDQLFKTVDMLHAAGVIVYFMRDTPCFAYHPPSAVVQYSRRGEDMAHLGKTVAQYEAENSHADSVLPQLRERGVTVLDPLPVFLARTHSTVILPCDADGLFYSDSAHISPHGARMLKSLFVDMFQSINAIKKGQGQ
ncbi:MAG: acyltransferase family protein [Verrucomicrobiaceae bacterium]